MIIDIHAHPTFSDFSQEGHLPSKTWDGKQKLDVVSDPSMIGAAMKLTAKQYKGQSPLVESVESFIKLLDQTHDLINFLCPLIKGQNANQSNEKAANLIQKFGDRAIGFAGFDPTSPTAVEDIDYAIGQLGFKGLKVIPSLMGLDINDKAFYPCYEKAEKLGVKIISEDDLLELIAD